MRPRLSAFAVGCFAIFLSTLCVVSPLCADPFTMPMIRLGQPGLGPGDETCYPNRPPYFFGDFNSAGYSDVVYYTTSPDHPYHGWQNGHETLSGEWASAIYYQGIQTGDKAMWLSDHFLFPYWDTNSNFAPSTSISQSSWDDPLNLVSLGSTSVMDTGVTAIANPDLEIVVDYELVDLAWNDPDSGSAWSPMAFKIEGLANTFYAKSQQYIMLQTYSLRNTKDVPIQGIEFYQMLHSHPGGEFGSSANSTYADAPPPIADPLASYVPLNPVHCMADSNTVGDFRFDITQWNDPNNGIDHVDFVGFSSAKAPDIVDHASFIGHGGSEEPGNHAAKPEEGLHINIENREFFDRRELSGVPVAGAMGWYLDDLEPNEITSITFAFMFGYKPEFPSDLTLDSHAAVNPPNPCDPNKVDPTNPPYNQIEYSIEYSRSVTAPEDANDLPYEGVCVVNKLASQVDFVSAYPANYTYDAAEHTCTWYLDPIHPGDSNSLTITVEANYSAAPGSIIDNKSTLVFNSDFLSSSNSVDVCCWQLPENPSATIYVDSTATGNNTGVSWSDAYVELYSALEQAANACGSEIWVAQGCYSPKTVGSPLGLSDGLKVYGGFPSGGGGFEERDYLNNPTLLTADIDSNTQSQTVIKAVDILSPATIDGFFIMNAMGYGVTVNNSSVDINNCVITANVKGGIFCNISDINIAGSVIFDNGGNGIFFCDDPYSTKHTFANIVGNQIYSNSEFGLSIITWYASVLAANNLINSNGTDLQGGGVYIRDPNECNPESGESITLEPVRLLNNTITYNNAVGVEAVNKTDFEIVNCIIWGHQLDAVDCNKISYSIFAQAEPGNGNSNNDPRFISDDPNEYHLASDSPCIDAGDPNRVYIGLFDLDGNERVIDVLGQGLDVNDIDIGADEYACDDVQNVLDFNGNNTVAMDDFIPIAERWLTYTAGENDPNDVYDVAPGEGDDMIDIFDFNHLVEEWQWQPCWQDDSSPLWIHHRPLLQSILK